MNWQDMPRLAEMTWRKDRPTKPGSYPWRINSDSPMKIVEVKPGNGTDPAYWQVRTSRGGQLLGLMHGEWAGPLKAPVKVPV